MHPDEPMVMVPHRPAHGPASCVGHGDVPAPPMQGAERVIGRLDRGSSRRPVRVTSRRRQGGLEASPFTGSMSHLLR